MQNVRRYETLCGGDLVFRAYSRRGNQRKKSGPSAPLDTSDADPALNISHLRRPRPRPPSPPTAKLVSSPSPGQLTRHGFARRSMSAIGARCLAAAAQPWCSER